MTRKIVLIGMPSCGKTKTAKKLAKLLDYDWADTDVLITERTDRPIPWLFEHVGEDGFRALEYQAISQALDSSAQIVALGGGAVTYGPTRELLGAHTVYYLHAEPDFLADRLDLKVWRDGGKTQAHTARPLLQGDYRARLRDLYSQRRSLYQELADYTVDAMRPVKEIARDICAQIEISAQTIWVEGDNPYPVVFQDNLITALTGLVPADAHRVLVLSAPTVQDRAHELAATITARGKNSQVMTLPDGEAAKNLEVLGQVWDKCADFGMERPDVIVTLGGGATTDLGGFAAATWLRGIRVIHAPTSLLAMLDAAIGGKTGIDWRTGKNLVGAFYPPLGVAISMPQLKTLPSQELVAGLGEALKCGFIQDQEILRLAREGGVELIDATDSRLHEVIRRSIAVKAAVVSADLYESGRREWLNYGHTLAHAIELSQNYQFSHGRAVAIGMVYAAHLGALLGIGPSDLPAQIVQRLETVGLPTTFTRASFEELLTLMYSDKKVRDSKLRFVLLEEIGKPRVVEVTQVEALREAAKLTGIPQ